MVGELLDRVEPLAEPLGALAGGGAVVFGFQIVRSFDDPDGVEDDAAWEGGLRRLSGQHQLLGFHFEVEVLQRLVALGASIDFDEYG